MLPGLEAAFVDIGIDKNGFLHADDVVMPGVELARRGRHGSKGKRISEVLKPGDEVVVQVVKDPLKTKGARLSMQISIAGRYLVYVPDGEGVGVSRRLPDKERDRLRKQAKGLDLGKGGAIIRTAAQGATREDFEREVRYLHKLYEVAAEARQGIACAGDGVPGGRPPGARHPRHLLRAVRARDRRRREGAPPAGVVLHPHLAGAARPARALQGQEAAVREARDRGRDQGDAQPAGRPARRAAT